MKAPITYRLIKPPECGALVRVHYRAFSSQQIVKTIYASPQVEHYLASLVEFSDWRAEHMLQGAWDCDQMVGYTHWRAVDGFWHLNQIVVLPEYQSCGIGKMFWKQWIAEGERRQFRHISLDVEAANRRALEWYRRQGLQVSSTTRTYEKEIEGVVPVQSSCDFARNRGEPIQIAGWENARAWQAAFGFSQFQLIYRQRQWPIGCLGRDYFRVLRYPPAPIEEALAQIDPHRRLLVMTSQTSKRSDLREVGVSLRMQGTL